MKIFRAAAYLWVLGVGTVFFVGWGALLLWVAGLILILLNADRLWPSSADTSR